MCICMCKSDAPSTIRFYAYIRPEVVFISVRDFTWRTPPFLPHSLLCRALYREVKMRIHTATCASESGYRSSQAPLSAARSCCMWYRGSHLCGQGVCLQVSRLVSPVAPVRVSAACLRRASLCLCRPPPWLIVAWWNCFRSEIKWNQQTWHRSDVYIFLMASCLFLKSDGHKIWFGVGSSGSLMRDVFTGNLLQDAV